MDMFDWYIDAQRQFSTDFPRITQFSNAEPMNQCNNLRQEHTGDWIWNGYSISPNVSIKYSFVVKIHLRNSALIFGYTKKNIKWKAGFSGDIVLFWVSILNSGKLINPQKIPYLVPWRLLNMLEKTTCWPSGRRQRAFKYSVSTIPIPSTQPTADL